MKPKKQAQMFLVVISIAALNFSFLGNRKNSYSPCHLQKKKKKKNLGSLLEMFRNKKKLACANASQHCRQKSCIYMPLPTMH